MELDSRKNEARSDMKQQDIAIEVSIGLFYGDAQLSAFNDTFCMTGAS